MGPPPTARGWGAQARALALLSSRAEQEQAVAVQKSPQADVRQAGGEGRALSEKRDSARAELQKALRGQRAALDRLRVKLERLARGDASLASHARNHASDDADDEMGLKRFDADLSRFRAEPLELGPRRNSIKSLRLVVLRLAGEVNEGYKMHHIFDAVSDLLPTCAMIYCKYASNARTATSWLPTYDEHCARHHASVSPLALWRHLFRDPHSTIRHVRMRDAHSPPRGLTDRSRQPHAADTLTLA